jgi:flagellar protein FlgJ
MQAINPAVDMDMIRNTTNAQKFGELKKGIALAPRKATEAEMDEVAQDFEAQFISSMMENMFSGLSTDGPMGGGESEQTYRSLMLDQYGKQIARSGGIGVADYVKREMLRLQEIQKVEA